MRLIFTIVFLGCNFLNAKIHDEEFGIFNHDGQNFKLELFEVSDQEEARMFNDHRNYEINNLRNHRSDQMVDLRAQMSAVRSQGERGSCSAFAAMGLLEEFLGKGNDFSEQCGIFFHDQKDAGNLVERLQMFPQSLRYEWSCPYIDPASFREWPRSTVDRKKQLRKFAKLQIPAAIMNEDHQNKILDGKVNLSEDFSLEQIEWMNFDDLSSADVIQHVKNYLSAGRPVGVSVFTPGIAWGVGMIDKIPSKKQIYKNCKKQNSDDEASKKKVCAGHAIVITGFDDKRGLFFFKNSWDKTWGLNHKFEIAKTTWEKTGYGAMSYEYYARFGKGAIVALRRAQ